MTRQKKEIIKKIDWLMEMIDADQRLGCWEAPESAYAEAYRQVDALEEQLARLSHYSSAEEMRNDDRAYKGLLAANGGNANEATMGLNM